MKELEVIDDENEVTINIISVVQFTSNNETRQKGSSGSEVSERRRLSIHIRGELTWQQEMGSTNKLFHGGIQRKTNFYPGETRTIVGRLFTCNA